jgi:hypothetical protein
LHSAFAAKADVDALKRFLVLRSDRRDAL